MTILPFMPVTAAVMACRLGINDLYRVQQLKQ